MYAYEFIGKRKKEEKKRKKKEEEKRKPCDFYKSDY